LERVGVFGLIPGRLGRMATLVNPPVASGPRLPKFLPAIGRRRARVAFFVGCVADAMFRHTHWATLRVLQQNGCDVLVPARQACCGAIHFHSGDSPGARALADANVAAFALDEVDAVIVNHAGCGAMLKEYGLHWHDDRREARQRLAEKVRDINEFLDQLGPIAPAGRIDAVATYHDACHLAHAQGVTDAPRQLLAMIPGLELIPLPESDMCCGAAGTYNLQEPEMARELALRKLRQIQATGAQVVIAANIGCVMQLRSEAQRLGVDLEVVHPVTLLYRAVFGPDAG
jgi:glycolate oxidase iron-sulfur subunit